MKTPPLLLVSSLLALVAGCSTMPTAPSVLVLPGSGRSFDDFRRDDALCRQFAAQQVGAAPSDPALRGALVGTAIGAVGSAAIGGHQGAGVGAGVGLLAGSAVGAGNAQSANYGSQRQYDNAFVQCMYASGHVVPVPGEVARGRAVVPSKPAPGNYPPPPCNPPPAGNPPPLPPR